MSEHEWECINEINGASTERLKIDGGWLYIHSYRNTISKNELARTMCFVPDIPIQKAFEELPTFKVGDIIYKCGFKGCIACQIKTDEGSL